ncbi:MAG: hypothetical protein ISS26_07590 [Candidatus Omnitrophica bacterium]|nr:hypothetical protein [Candidatus Omnitrophota bacterium]
MTKSRIGLIILALLGTAFIVYSPHYSYPFPCHIDEWHHISEAMRLERGEYGGGVVGFRIGFQLILLLLSRFMDLVTGYKYLPAVWSIVSALVLFMVAYKKTDRRFYIALFSVLFFASIKSNVNITGLWFFSPLTFSIPFIYLYVYLFTEGVEKQNKKSIRASLAIMLFLVPFHSISFLFAVPFLLVYSVCNFGYFKKEWKFFCAFLMIPVAGAVFYKFMAGTPWQSLTGKLVEVLQFKRGWGVLEIKNSFYELYSLAGYITAGIGLALIFLVDKKTKKYLAYALWPIAVLVSILIYRKTDVSYISPYQRNLYYFVIALPLLSAMGLDYTLRSAARWIKNLDLSGRQKAITKGIATCLILITAAFFTFKSYWDIPRQIDLYEVVKQDEYEALLFLKGLPKTTVLASPRISTGLYPISGHQPVATYFFYGNRPDAERFFRTKECDVKNEILAKYEDIKYVLSRRRIDCGWKCIYDDRVYIYELKPQGEEKDGDQHNPALPE